MICSTTIQVTAIFLGAVLLRISHAYETQVISNSIAANPLYVRLIGNFDPREEDVYFISALQISFDEYYLTQYTDILNGFDIAAIFFYQATENEFQNQTAIDDSESATKIKSWCEIQTAFSIPIDLDPSTFNIDIATQFVTDFFSNEQSAVLLNRLTRSSNISISTIEVFAGTSDTVRAELEGYVDFISPSNASSSSHSKVLKILASVSGTIICVAVVALIISTFIRGHDVRNNQNRLGIQKRDDPSTDVNTNRIEQAYSNTEDEFTHHYNDKLVATLNDEQSQQDNVYMKKGDPPIVSSDSFTIDDGNDSDGTVVARNQASPATSHYNSPTTTNSYSSGSPVWSMFSGTGSSTDHTTSPYSTEEVLQKRYRWHDCDADTDVDISQLLSLPEEPRSPGTSSYHSSKCGANDESVSTCKSTSHDP